MLLPATKESCSLLKFPSCDNLTGPAPGEETVIKLEAVVKEENCESFHHAYADLIGQNGCERQD
jgi:hypothetical protein